MVPDFATLPDRRRTSPEGNPVFQEVSAPQPRWPTRLATTGLTILAAIGALHVTKPLPQFEEGPFAGFLAKPSLTAYGESGELKLKFALPGKLLSYPLDVAGDPSHLTYAWTSLDDTALAGQPRDLVGSNVAAPMKPGF